jgi:hypothetical protein
MKTHTSRKKSYQHTWAHTHINLEASKTQVEISDTSTEFLNININHKF